MLERHAATTQAFIPMAKAGAEWEEFNGEKALKQTTGGGMIVVGCLNGPGEFILRGSQAASECSEQSLRRR